MSTSTQPWIVLLAVALLLPACDRDEAGEGQRPERSERRDDERADDRGSEQRPRTVRPPRSQRPEPSPLRREPEPPDPDATWQEKQAHELSIARQFLSEVGRNEGGATPPDTIAQAFDQRLYPPGSVMVQLTLGEIVGRALLPNFDAPPGEGVASFKMGPWGRMTVVPDGGAFVRAAFEGEGDLERVNAVREKLLKAGNLDMAAAYDEPGGEAWEALAEAHPEAKSMFRANRWKLPVPLVDRGHLRYHIVIEPEMVEHGAIPSMHAMCRAQMRYNQPLREGLGLAWPYEFSPVDEEVCLWVALAGALEPDRNREPILPQGGPWALPARAADQGTLRGFVVVEIVSRYARAHVLSLSQEDRLAASMYVKGLYEENPRPAKGPMKAPPGTVAPRTITPGGPAKGR